MPPPPKPPNALSVLLQEGLRLHSAGKVDEAMQRYSRVLGLAGANPDANYLMGTALLQKQKPAEALPWLEKAVRLRDDLPHYRSNLAVVLKQLGRLDAAERELRTALVQAPDSLDVLGNLSNVCVLREDWPAVEATCRRILELRPGSVDHHMELSRALIRQTRPCEAAEVLQALLRLAPGHVTAMANLGVALRDGGRFDEAEVVFKQARDLDPDSAEVLSNYGMLLSDLDRYAESESVLRRCVTVHPRAGMAWHNLSLALKALGKISEAEAAARQAVMLTPDSPEAHTNIGFLRLIVGDLDEGFREYEWRSRMADFPSPKRDFPLPLWTDQPLPGLRLIVHDEQGVGDALQFLRYCRVLKERGATVILECNRQIARLLRSAPDIDIVLSRGEPPPPADAYVPLLSLAQRFGTRLDSIPGGVPYLHSEPELRERWATRLGPRSGALRVGLVWAGNPAFKDDRLRSPGLPAVLPLLGLPGTEVYALQKGAGRADLERMGLPPGLIDLGPEIGDFADTAAIMDNLDLVISSCTGPAHLAAAMGRPTWVILPFAPDWRWLLERSDSPWYPTVRLFRQPAMGRWDAVVADVRTALAAMAPVPA